LTKTGSRNSREFERAYVLLALDKGKKHQEITDFYNVSRITIWRIKNKYLEFEFWKRLKTSPAVVNQINMTKLKMLRSLPWPVLKHQRAGQDGQSDYLRKSLKNSMV